MWKVPWFDYKHSGVSSLSPPAHLPQRFQSYWMWNPQSSLTLKNPHVHSHLFIRGIMHWEMLLHCQGAFCEEGKAHDEESQAPFPPQLQCHGIMSASQPPCLPKQGTTPLKTRYFQIQFITIHLFQSPVLWSFTKLLLKWSSLGLSSVVPLQKQELDTHTHSLSTKIHHSEGGTLGSI